MRKMSRHKPNGPRKFGMVVMAALMSSPVIAQVHAGEPGQDDSGARQFPIGGLQGSAAVSVERIAA